MSHSSLFLILICNIMNHPVLQIFFYEISLLFISKSYPYLFIYVCIYLCVGLSGVLQDVQSCLSKQLDKDFNRDQLKITLKDISTKSQFPFNKLMKLLRHAISGLKVIMKIS